MHLGSVSARASPQRLDLGCGQDRRLSRRTFPYGGPRHPLASDSPLKFGAKPGVPSRRAGAGPGASSYPARSWSERRPVSSRTRGQCAIMSSSPRRGPTLLPTDADQPEVRSHAVVANSVIPSAIVLATVSSRSAKSWAPLHVVMSQNCPPVLLANSSCAPPLPGTPRT